MKGVTSTGFGLPEEVLKQIEAPKPVPNDNQVIIQVKASSVNITDYMQFVEPVEGKEISQTTRMIYERMDAFGKVIGMDVAGIVDEVGSKVTKVKKGDEVFAFTADWLGGWGEYACANENEVALKPSNLSFEEAAVLPGVSTVALGACRTANVQAGQQVLVNGASGGVGTALVQVLKTFGAIVTGVCSSRNVDMVRNCGADYIIDYTKEDFAKSDKTYDCIFGVNGYHTLEDYKNSLKPGGIYVLVGNQEQGADFRQIGEEIFKGSGKRLGAVAFHTVEREMPYIKQLIEDGKLKPVIDNVYSIHEIVDAINYIVKNHAKGKIAIKMDF